MAHLVVVIGPIGAGKSTVARLLAGRLLAAGRTVAVWDLDDVVTMASGPPSGLASTWERARRAHGALVGGWLASGVDVVIAHGPICTPDETATLMAHVPDGTPTTRVLLLASCDAALARITIDPDPGRVVSRDPVFLRAAHDRFAAVIPSVPACDHTVATEQHPADDIAASLAAELLA